MANEIKQKKITGFSYTSVSTPALTLTSLASAAGRVGAVKDLGATHARVWRIRLKTKFAVAPTEGKLLEIWLSTAPGSDGSGEDGDVGTADAALSVAASRYQCQLLGVMYCRATTDAQFWSCEALLSSQFISPVIFNNTDQALSSTAGDHELTFEPYVEEVQ